MKKDNYKYVIGLIIGVVISMVGAYATTKYDASSIYNNPAGSTLTSTNVQDAIDELAAKYKTVFKDCPSNLICKKAGASDYTALTLGDYINYTPPTTSFTTDGSYTGCPGSGSYACKSSTQTINPSQLSSWRVISKNEDGTVDIVSEYASSTEVYFFGKTGYQNLVLGLRTIANAYKDDGTLISSARPFGYSNQADTVSLNSSSGDIGYYTDIGLVNTALGTIAARKAGSTIFTKYWMTSRYYISGTYYSRYVDGSGSAYSDKLLYSADNGALRSEAASLRIILTLNEDLLYYKAGTNGDYKVWNISA